MATLTIDQALVAAAQCRQAERLADAEQIYRRILTAFPNNPDALQGLANLALQADRTDAAYALIHQSMAHRTSLTAEHYHNAGWICFEALAMAESIRWNDLAIRARPGWAEPHVSKGMALLMLGQWTAAWPEFAHRWRVQSWDTHLKTFEQPRWTGQEIAGKTLLLWAEQGLGDVMQLARYFPVLAERGAKIVVGCQEPIRPLIATVRGVSACVFEVADTPPFDFHAPIFEVMPILGATPDNLPPAPYIFADPELKRRWGERVKRVGKRLNVGIAWTGRPENQYNRFRSIPAAALSPLWQARPDAAFYSLQKGPGAAQAAGLPLIDWTEDLTDFAHTAALVANLDLVITVCTSTAHLAGAMGAKTWTLLYHRPDWRWMLDREDSVWYPSMRLFRQPKRGDWASVIQRISAELKQL